MAEEGGRFATPLLAAASPDKGVQEGGGRVRLVLAGGYVAVLAVILGLSVSFLALSRQEEVDEVQAQGASLARLVAAYLDDAIVSVDRAVLRVRDELQGTEVLRTPVPGRGLPFSENSTDTGKLAAELRLQAERVLFLRSLSVFDSEGRVVASSGRLEDVAFSAPRLSLEFHRNYPRDGLRLGGLPATGPLESPGFLLTRRFSYPDGRFAGVIAAVMDGRRIQTLISQLALGPRDVVSVRLEDGFILARRPSTDSGAPTALFRATLVQDAIPEGVASERAVYPGDGRVKLVSVSRLPVAAVAVRVALDEGDALASWWRHTVAFAVIFPFLALGFGVWVWWVDRRFHTAVKAWRAVSTRAIITREVIDEIPAGVCVWKPDIGVIMANRTWTALTGSVQAASPLPMVLGGLCRPDSPEGGALNEGLQSVLVGESRHYSQSLVLPQSLGLPQTGAPGAEGEAHWLLQVVRSGESPGGLIMMFLQNITGQQQTLSACRKEVGRLQNILDLSQCLVLETDAKGIVLALNVASARSLGRSAPDVVGRNWVELAVLPERRDAERVRFGAILAEGGGVAEQEIVAFGTQGRVIEWHRTVLRDAEGSPVRVVAVGQDVTGRARNEQALREARRRLHLAETLARVGTWEERLPRRLVWWSDEVCRLLGRSSTELGSGWDTLLTLVAPDHRGRLHQAVQGLGTGQAFSLEVPVQTTTRGEAIIRIHGEPSYSESGALIGAMGIVHDVTGQRRANEIIYFAGQKAALADRARRTLLSGVAHSLNTPLATLKGFAELLAEEKFGPLGDDHYRDYARAILEAANALHETITKAVDDAGDGTGTGTGP